MTLGIAWVAQRPDKLTHLYIASDSRTSGEMIIDNCPKILTLPRSDCAICFAGSTFQTYPLMLQLANAIDAHGPSRDRRLDIENLKDHLLRVFSHIVRGMTEAVCELKSQDMEFIFCGYSWVSKAFRIWIINYDPRNKKFIARPCTGFHEDFNQIAFIGDVAAEARKRLHQKLRGYAAKKPEKFEFEPLKVMRDMLREADQTATIGGAPQLVRIAEHMNTRVIAINWCKPASAEKKIYIMGRKVFERERTDVTILDIDTLSYSKSAPYDHREEKEFARNPRG